MKYSLIAAVGIMLATAVQGQVPIYDNSQNEAYPIRYYPTPGTLEFGDEVNFDIGPGVSRYLTRFDFEYWGINTANPSVFAGNVEVKVKFYKNDGPLSVAGYATPSTSIWESGWFGISPTERNRIAYLAGSDFAAGGLYLAEDKLTWTVQFRGMGATDSVGVDVYGPPVVGTSAQDFWLNDPLDGGWVQKQNEVDMNFACRFFVVPEPSSMGLLLLGGGLLAAMRRSRKQ